MSDLAHTFQGYIQVEEAKFKAAVSEYTARRVGSNMNYLKDQMDALNAAFAAFLATPFGNIKHEVTSEFTISLAETSDTLKYSTPNGLPIAGVILTPSRSPTGVTTNTHTSQMIAPTGIDHYFTWGDSSLITGGVSPNFVQALIPFAYSSLSVPTTAIVPGGSQTLIFSSKIASDEFYTRFINRAGAQSTWHFKATVFYRTN